MKVYFACSIRGGRGDAELYAELATYVKQKSELLTEIFADKKLTSQGMAKPSAEIWKIDTDWVKQADCIIAEVTNPSLGVGYEIAKAEEWKKPVLALYRPSDERKLSAMIDGSPLSTTVYYSSLEEAKAAIDTFLNLTSTRQRV